MKNDKRKLFRYVLVSLVILLLVILTALPVIAAASSPITVLGNITTGQTALGSTYGTSPEPYTNSFVAEGRHWIFYLDGISSFRYTSFIPGSELSRETRLIEFGTGLYAVEFSIFYDETNNTVHYARHNTAPDPDTVVYRMGTPNANGTITWAAAEQTVSTTPAVLATWRTTIAVDEDGNPWIAWIDTDGGVDPEGIVYVEASSTHDGTWTQVVAVSDTIDIADYHAWFLQLCPIATTPGNLMELVWSCECQDGGGDDGEVALYARRYHSGTGWTATETIAALGEMAAAAPEAFDSYDIGSSIWCVYTQAGTGDIRCRARSSIQTWATADAAETIYDTQLVGATPTISGYKNVTLGEDLICVINVDTISLDWLTHDYGDDIDDWNAMPTIWTVDTALIDIITRHTAAYKYGSGVGFTWQVQHDDGVDDYDTAYYWWIDNNSNAIGGYTPTGNTAGNWILQAMIPLVIAIGIILTAFGFWKGNILVAFSGIAVGIVGFVFAQALLNLL